jgi:ABC-2 type transport system ATP-binding protein
MDDFAIKVDSVSKTFKLPHEKHSSVKSVLLSAFNGKRSYEKQKVLKEVSFEIKKGEFFGIVGRNGSGKSTLLKLLAGIYAPDTGVINVNGKLTPFIELGVGFNPELTGRENVYLNGALLGFNRKEVDLMYEEIVEFAELERFMDQKLKNYSSGMQVRLAFSIAIRAESDILLIDEVLAVGDESFQRKCMEYFVRVKQTGRTVVFVTHDMSQVRRFCDRAIFIKEGNVIFEGLPARVAEQYTLENLKLNTKSESRQTLGEEVKLKSKFISDSKLNFGDKLTLEISWSHQAKVENAGVSILKDSGEYIFGVNTILDKFKVKGNKITISVDCNLSPGKYNVTVGLFRKSDVDIVAYNPAITEFFILPSEKTSSWEGVAFFNHKWE